MNNSNYLNRTLVTEILSLKMLCAQSGLIMAQTNSRRNGRYLNCVRVYKSATDKGNPCRAIYCGRTVGDIREIIAELNS